MPPLGRVAIIGSIGSVDTCVMKSGDWEGFRGSINIGTKSRNGRYIISRSLGQMGQGVPRRREAQPGRESSEPMVEAGGLWPLCRDCRRQQQALWMGLQDARHCQEAAESGASATVDVLRFFGVPGSELAV